MNKFYLFLVASIFESASLHAQAHYDTEHMQTEKLNRGVVAVRCEQGVAVSWRLLPTDSRSQAFNVFRNGVKLNRKPLSKGGTFFMDTHPLSTDALYTVRTSTGEGSWLLKANSPMGYLPIDITPPVPADSTDPGNRNYDGSRVTYSANDCSVGDVDGDGQYEVFLKWDPSNSRDNSMAGFTANVYIDCYRFDGTRLWRINLGRNIRAGAHYTQFLVYDFDGDGKAEMICKTADGTVDGEGNTLGDATADYRSRQPGNTYGRVMSGPEYLTVFSGLTGKAIYTTNYVPERGDVRSWGDDHANRSERYLAAVAYLDGVHPSAVFCRGYYTRSCLCAWHWNGKELQQQWFFDSNQVGAAYAGQGNHNLRTADVDSDGKDEITYGAMAVDDDGSPLYSTGMGHGDALHLVAEPKTNRLFIWDVHENRRDGSELRDAATGKVVFQIKAPFDVGRGMAADIDPSHPGEELWSSGTGGLLSFSGQRIMPEGTTGQENDYSRPSQRFRLSCNFAIWWDGDLLRELLDRATISKYDPATGRANVLLRLNGVFNNGTKQNPCLSADVLGDWREEVLLRNAGSTQLRLYVSPIPTPYRFNCLMTDPPYRESVAAENVGYNQPPEPGYYLGTGM